MKIVTVILFSTVSNLFGPSNFIHPWWWKENPLPPQADVNSPAPVKTLGQVGLRILVPLQGSMDQFPAFVGRTIN